MLNTSVGLLLLGGGLLGLLLLLVMVPDRDGRRSLLAVVAGLFRLHRIQHLVVLNEVVDEFARLAIFQMLIPHAGLLQERLQRVLLAAQIEPTRRAPADVRHVLKVRRHPDVLFPQPSLGLVLGGSLVGCHGGGGRWLLRESTGRGTKGRFVPQGDRVVKGIVLARNWWWSCRRRILSGTVAFETIISSPISVVQRGRGGVHKRRSFILHRKVERHDALRPLEHDQERPRLGDLDLLVQLLLPDLAVGLQAVQPEVVRLADVVLDEAERPGPLFDPGSVGRRLRHVQLDNGGALGLTAPPEQSKELLIFLVGQQHAWPVGLAGPVRFRRGRLLHPFFSCAPQNLSPSKWTYVLETFLRFLFRPG